MGYPFLVRLSLAAMAMQGAGAVAGAIEGSITFPSQLVPSMTVYAADLETLRIHSAQLVRGQANFTVEVPPGRYLLFLAPNETGAPNVYGTCDRCMGWAAFRPQRDPRSLRVRAVLLLERLLKGSEIHGNLLLILC